MSKVELAVALSHILLLKPVKVAADGMSAVQNAECSGFESNA